MDPTPLLFRRRFLPIFVVAVLALIATEILLFRTSVVAKIRERRAYESLTTGMSRDTVENTLGPTADTEVPRPSYEMVEGDVKATEYHGYPFDDILESRRYTFETHCVVVVFSEKDTLLHKAYLRRKDASIFWRALDRLGL